MNISPSHRQIPTQSFSLTTAKLRGFLALTQPSQALRSPTEGKQSFIKHLWEFWQTCRKFCQFFCLLFKKVSLHKVSICSSSRLLRQRTPGATKRGGETMKGWRCLCFSGGSDRREMIPHVGFSATMSYSLHSWGRSTDQTCPFWFGVSPFSLSLVSFIPEKPEVIFSFATKIHGFILPLFQSFKNIVHTFRLLLHTIIIGWMKREKGKRYINLAERRRHSWP